MPNVDRFVFTYHLPLFMIITGYFINEKHSIGQFSKRRFRSTMLPYTITCLAIIFLGTLKGFLSGNALSELKRWTFASVYGAGLSYEKPFHIPQIGAIWYLPATCVGSILLRISLKASKGMRPFLIVGLFAVGFTTSKLLFWFPMSVQAGFCSVFFMYMGWLYRQNEASIQAMDAEVKTIATIIAAVVWLSFVIQFQGFLMAKNSLGRGIVDIIGTLCASALLLMGSRIIDEKTHVLRRLLTFAGRYSLLILCLHIVELDLFPWRFVFNHFWKMSDPLFGGIMFFLKPAALLLAAWIALKSKLVRRIFGYETIR